MVSALTGTSILAVIAVVFTAASVLLALAMCKLRGKCGFRAWRPTHTTQERDKKGRDGLRSYALQSLPTGPYSTIYEEIQMRESWLQSGIYEDVEVGRPLTRVKDRDTSNVSLISVSRMENDTNFAGYLVPCESAPHPSTQSPPHHEFSNPVYEKDTVAGSTSETDGAAKGQSVSPAVEALYSEVNKGKKRVAEPTSERDGAAKEQCVPPAVDALYSEVNKTKKRDCLVSSSKSTPHPSTQSPPHLGFNNPMYEKDVLDDRVAESMSETDGAAKEQSVPPAIEILYAKVNKENKRPKSETTTTEPVYACVDIELKRKLRSEKAKSLPESQGTSGHPYTRSQNMSPSEVPDGTEDDTDLGPGYASLDAIKEMN